jgi:branched-chain amino acid transport system substrate-binding protein
MNKYYPDGGKTDSQTVYGYSIGEVTARIPNACGDDMTHENAMRQAAR